MEVDPKVAVTRAVLEKIAMFANQPLKRILADDSWATLQIVGENLIYLAYGLQTIVRERDPKAIVTRSDIFDATVRDAVMFVLYKSELGNLSPTDADELINITKRL